MRNVGMLPPDHAPIRWEHLEKTYRTTRKGQDGTKMPNGWFVPYGPRLVEVQTYDAVTNRPTATEHVDHATLLRLLWDRMGDIAGDEVIANGGRWSLDMMSEYTVLSAAFDLIHSDLDTGGSLALWRGPRELVDMALTLATTADDRHTFIETIWATF